PADLLAALPQDVRRLGDPCRLAVAVPQVGMPRRGAERLLAPGAADQDRKPRLDRARQAQCVDHRVEAPVMGHLLTREKPLDEADRLLEPVEPLAEAGPEVEPEGLVLAVEPAAADAQDEPPARHVIEGGRELRGQARIAERVGGDEEPEASSRR